MGKGGGGSPAPQNSTTQTSNIPAYARPYVESMLGATQRQLFEGNTTGTGKNKAFEITGFKPYQAYSSNPEDYFAGPSSLQQQVYGEAGQMQTPGGFGAAQGLSGLSAMGQLGAGRQYQEMATDPFAIQGYMSPYMQNVVDTQKVGALRDFQIGQTARQGQQTLRGAFGGSRSAIENAEAQRALNSQLQNIQATGTQKAYEDAQRAQQFGANLNLQGLQGAGQMAGQIGQLAGAQQQADLARLGFQQQTGQQQQQYQQNIINQAIQDYATAQQYPYMQLGMMSNMLRGLPMQQMTTQSYQAAPNALSQLGGLAATGIGAYGAAGGFRGYKEGGTVDSYADGGVVGNIEAQLMQMDVPQLTEVVKTSPSVSIRQKAAEILAQKQMATQSQRSMGLEGAPAGNLDDIGMAGGGIIAFAEGDLVDEEKRKEYEKYGEPGSLKRKFKSILDYYQSPSSVEGVKRNILNTSMALGPVSGTPVAMGPGVISRGLNYASDVPGVINQVRGVTNAVTGGGALPVPTGDGRESPAAAAPDSVAPAAAPSSGAPAGGGGSGGAEGKYEAEIQELMGSLKKGLGEGRAQKDLDALREEMRANKDQNLWMSLIQGGAKAMQSTSPHALVGLGAGVEEGAKAYGKGLEGERADKKLLLAQQSALEQAEYARKTGNLNALIAAQTRLDAVKAQRENLGAQKELAILSARDKAYGDLVGRLYVQTQDIDQAKAMADKVYSSTNLGGMPGGSAPTKSAIPKVGEVRGGYRFNGGNPNDKNNWSKV